MYYNESNDYIIKRKKGNLLIDSDKVSIEIDNDIVLIRWKSREYTIELKNIVNVKKQFELVPISETEHSSTRGEIYNYYIRLEYIKDNKIKILNLKYYSKKQEENGLIWRTEKEKETRYLEEKDVDSLVNYFITAKKSRTDSNYIDIRSNDENEYIEKLINKETKNTKIGVNVFIIVLLVMFFIYCLIGFYIIISNEMN